MISSFPYDRDNPFYNPQSNYGWQGQNPQWQDYIGNVGYTYGEREPEAAWTSKLAELGLGGMDAQSSYSRALYGRAQEGYKAAKLKNLALNWQDYLKTLDIPGMWIGLSPEERGFNEARSAPVVRWQQRS